MKVTIVPSVILMDKFVLGEVRGEDNWQPIAVVRKFMYEERAVSDTYEASRQEVWSNICTCH